MENIKVKDTVSGNEIERTKKLIDQMERFQPGRFAKIQNKQNETKKSKQTKTETI